LWVFPKEAKLIFLWINPIDEIVVVVILNRFGRSHPWPGCPEQGRSGEDPFACLEEERRKSHFLMFTQ
jgi:hypothetical protein